MKWWNYFYEKWVVRILVKEPLKHGSYLLSHGGFHIIAGGIVFALTIILAQANINASEDSLRRIVLKVDHLPANDSVRISSYTINFIIDSDSLLKENGNHNSKIAFLWRFKDLNSEIKGHQFDDTIKVSYMDETGIENIEITDYNDSILKYQSDDSDSNSIEINISPKAEVSRLTGGYRTGSAGATIYTNNLGLNTDSNSSSWILRLLGLSPSVTSYNYSIGFRDLPNDSCDFQMISFQFGGSKWYYGYHDIANKKLLYKFIYPEPDVLNNGYISYQTRESIEKVKQNHGIIIQAVDLDKQNENSKKSIIASILVGTGAALLFDILIQLVRELRNVNRKRDEEMNNNKK